jgi:hypothetical protein
VLDPKNLQFTAGSAGSLLRIAFITESANAVNLR